MHRFTFRWMVWFGAVVVWVGGFPAEGKDFLAAASQQACVEAGDIYSQEALNLDSVNLGAVVFSAGLLPDDSTAYLDVTDCSGDGILDIAISRSGAEDPIQASMTFSPNLCSGNAPQVVEILLQHESSCTLKAYDETFTQVDTATALVSSATQWLTLNSPAGIRTILFEGSVICILRVCWSCEPWIENTPTPTPTSTPSPTPNPNCAEAGEVYSEEVFNLESVNLGMAEFTSGILLNGSTSYLHITDCSGDGGLDVLINRSDEEDPVQVKMVLSSNLCSGNAPQQVNLLIRNGNACVLTAYDETFTKVDSATAASSLEPQWVTLGSPAGIRTVLFTGSEICVLRVCRDCQAHFEDTPTPTVTTTPTATEQQQEPTSTPTSTPRDTATPTPTSTNVLRPTVRPGRECIDFNGDNIVDHEDLLIFITEWQHAISN